MVSEVESFRQEGGMVSSAPAQNEPIAPLTNEPTPPVQNEPIVRRRTKPPDV